VQSGLRRIPSCQSPGGPRNLPARFLAQLALAGLWSIWLLTACQSAAPSLPDSFSPLPPRATPSAEVDVIVLYTQPAPVASPTPPAPPVFELAAGQHLSARGNFSDTETLAAGPMICHIERNSPAFWHLATYAGSDILFGEGGPAPYNDEDRRMHPALIGPLTRLAELARAEWGPETQIMVNAAYDSRMVHDLGQSNETLKYSLHFEGRSLDVIPWPPNLPRLARLCALAHTAGFDWVHNEGDHCHMSQEAESLCTLYGGAAQP
jgi:hypothetical protein